jgi:penicillin-insensitive murein DD-endopeptidase
MKHAWVKLVVFAATFVGCTHSPTPLYPGKDGSIGLPAFGVLRNGVQLPASGPGYKRLRQNRRNFGTPRMVTAVETTLHNVARARPGSETKVGDISSETGGQSLPHFSHRSGRDVDILPYYQTLSGSPVSSPDFLPIDRDGLASDGSRFLRFDTERQWILIRELLAPEHRTQWIFIHTNLRSLLLEWAAARGEPGEIILRASQVMLEPNPGGAHDDHIHVRTACSDEEMAKGCEWSGPVRAWFSGPGQKQVSTDAELVAELFSPLER